jgi:hypothetical protein
LLESDQFVKTGELLVRSAVLPALKSELYYSQERKSPRLGPQKPVVVVGTSTQTAASPRDKYLARKDPWKGGKSWKLTPNGDGLMR